MNKAGLVEEVAQASGMPKAQASQAVDAVIASIKKAMMDDIAVSVVGFGTFSVKERAARIGRNPRTGEPVDIKKSRVVAFKPAKAFKDELNQ